MDIIKKNLNIKKKIQSTESSIIKYPYGENDPYAIIELVASTQIYSKKYNIDQMPVLSARVSHASSGKSGNNPDADLNLMRYLADNEHLSPFEHQSVTFKVILPLFVAREWMRHRTQSYNEVSMRYSSDPVGKFYFPLFWRKQEVKNKQSSLGMIENQKECTEILKQTYQNCLDSYKKLLDLGVCREQARLVVPVGNYTQYYATANLRNWFNFYRLRIDGGAQWEIRQYAKCIDEILSQIWPNSWNVLKETLDKKTKKKAS
ncbi:FAD-dependent thymidylate synthase [Candidatus Dependentiae bacterium]|nr:FAD-dependent thymidylate synthase [Candidatus Dependentiae bacterium]